MNPPLEQEIDRELALEEQQRQNGTTDSAAGDYQTATTTISATNTKDTDSAISSDCEPEEHSNEPPTQIVTNDLKSLHERVGCPFSVPFLLIRIMLVPRSRFSPCSGSVRIDPVRISRGPMLS